MVAGLAAVVFLYSIQAITQLALGGIAGYYPRLPAGESTLHLLPATGVPFRPFLLLIVPTMGGLLCGLLCFYLAPEAEGHGTNNVIDSYHREQGRVRPIVPLVKIVASALTIGTGGSGGREGPIAQIGAGFGSMLAQWTGRGPRERRTLLAAGMGAGIAAIFRAPLAGALFAAEVLYSSAELEASVLVPAGIASAVAYCVFGSFFGFSPLFSTPDLRFTAPIELIGYTVLAGWLVVLASLYVRTYYAVEASFRRLPLSPAFRPALGALATGAVALAIWLLLARNDESLAILGAGYGILQAAFDPSAVPATVLLAVALGKILATALTIGSGGSGGVFGPAVVIGGCGGGALGLWLHDLVPSAVPHPASFVLIGMAGFFSAAAKTPFSSLVIVSELTGDYHLLVPAVWVCLLTFVLSDSRSIYNAQPPGRPRSPADPGSYLPAVLEQTSIRHLLLLEPRLPLLVEKDTLGAALDYLMESPYLVLPVLRHDNSVAGIVGLEEACQAARAGADRSTPVHTFLRTDIAPLGEDDLLGQAVEQFAEYEILMLPVVDASPERKFVGMLRRFDVDRAYLEHLSRQPG